MTYVIVSKEVTKALAQNVGVVALESTIISHGMPYPENLSTGISLEEEVRNYNAVPATIGIIDGEVKVGLNRDEMEMLALSGHKAIKTSRRDIPFVMEKKLTGATTVASTMIFAKMAGIKIFATGGIGGVHRAAENTMDVSADLTELGNTNVAVVSAGVKSILDIGLTLEYLETLGVPVVGYGTDEFPAFYTRGSGFGVDYRIDSPIEMAKILHTKWAMGLNGGVVIGNPVPEEFSYDKNEIDIAISKALLEADNLDIKGKETTPFLLSKIKDLTKGKSLETNIALAKNNARVAAQIAVELAKLSNP